jgi:hypothetical protein
VIGVRGLDRRFCALDNSIRVRALSKKINLDVVKNIPAKAKICLKQLFFEKLINC